LAYLRSNLMPLPSDDPLIDLWRDTSRPLNWRLWQLITVCCLGLALGSGILPRVAAAECAWLLWHEKTVYRAEFPNMEMLKRKQTPQRPLAQPSSTQWHDWTLIGGYANASACAESEESIVTYLEKPKEDIVNADYSFKYEKPERLGINIISQVVEYRGPESTTRDHSISRYLCLPDTVDPRRAPGQP
jgi:hypothetical protein